ncbi:MAG TPA: glutamate--tRNA ligase [Desulfobacteraceae bacterium]|nr:glutamate--tRNA ligase [Desulfobacteraceae bacterium]
MENQVVVRFAPSPTGYLHIGGARTAIFNWLYARQNKGKFILRIEDTDAQRSTKDSIQGIVDGLTWLGLGWDEGPNFQSAYIKDHLAAAQQLVDAGHAYKCFCTKEDLDRKREAAVAAKQTYLYDGTCRELTPDQVAENEAKDLSFTIRLKVPRDGGSLVFEDAVYGRVEKQFRDLEDFIIVRSNGNPLYILSNAVDDIRDRVTHIIRGQDGLANTPKQILLYQALGAPLPVFAHMSLTLDPKKAKISKRRHGELVAIHYYRAQGFLPWALVNFLVLLGWATTDSREIFSEEELIAAFALNGISRANSVFNIRPEDTRFSTDPKALNINAHYLRTMDIEDLADQVKPFLEAEGLWHLAYEGEGRRKFLDTLDLLRERYHLLTDFATLGRAWFSDDFEMDAKAWEKHLASHPELHAPLAGLGEKILAMDDYTIKTVEALLRDMLKTLGVKPGILINAVRMALTGQPKGPDFMKAMIVMGQQRVGERLRKLPAQF